MRSHDPKRAAAVYDIAIQRLHEVPDNLSTSRDLSIIEKTKDYRTEQVKLDSDAYVVASALADYEAQEGDPHSAVQVYEDLLDKVMAAKPEPLTDLRDAPRMSRLYESLAVLYRRTGETAQAKAMDMRRLDL